MSGNAQTAGNLVDSPSLYVWNGDDLLPSEGMVEVTIGDLPLALDLRLPHERRYALGLLHGLRNPQADIDRGVFARYVLQGDVVLDVGANIGFTAAEALACGARHVICVEPEQTLVDRLNVLKLRAQDRITVIHCALGAQQGFVDLLLSKPHNQGHTISRRMMMLFPSVFDGTFQKVSINTIDRILTNQAPAVWKIDVEGAESDVIRGARSTLKRNPPRAIIAELYDPFLSEFIALLPGFNVQRAALTRVGYALKMLDQIGGDLSDEFCPISPTYVFTKRD